MPEAERPDLEARIRAEVDRAVAPYERIAPPYVVAKMRELAERYWRENPVAARALLMADRAKKQRSGTETVGDQGDEGAADAAKKA